MTSRTWLVVAFLGSVSICGAAYDFQHASLSEGHTTPSGTIVYKAKFSDNGQPPVVPTVFQFFEIQPSQDNLSGYHVIADPFIASLNNPDTTPPTDPVFNALFSFKTLYFAKINSYPISAAAKAQAKQDWLDIAYLVYSEQP